MVLATPVNVPEKGWGSGVQHQGNEEHRDGRRCWFVLALAVIVPLWHPLEDLQGPLSSSETRRRELGRGVELLSRVSQLEALRAPPLRASRPVLKGLGHKDTALLSSAT